MHACLCRRIFNLSDSSVSLQDHPIIDQSALVGWTTKEWDSFCLPKEIFLRVARDPVCLVSNLFFYKYELDLNRLLIY